MFACVCVYVRAVWVHVCLCEGYKCVHACAWAQHATLAHGVSSELRTQRRLSSSKWVTGPSYGVRQHHWQCGADAVLPMMAMRCLSLHLPLCPLPTRGGNAIPYLAPACTYQQAWAYPTHPPSCGNLVLT